MGIYDRTLEKKRLLAVLTEEEIFVLTKSPFMLDRNALIHKIYSKGVSGYLLAEITGLGHSTIHQIGTRGPNYGLRRGWKKKSKSV